ncbi:O-acyltransferase like protein [Galendromus occidentalis]|uniref:O-acyltransferase like protein n=1 Tax=Galendromus occidentalis TaxID=34638 RepID=A0AAJ6VY53_9ACAR|nr:O-acyltransferase like protein [Galendromus occidentalis]
MCSSRLLTLLIGARNNQVWAFRIMAANGYVTPNVFEGSLGAMGGYSQCVKTRNLDGNLRGSYCTTYLTLPRHLIAELEGDFQKYGYMLGRRRLDALDKAPVWGYTGLRMGLCFLDGCTEDELTYVLRSLLGDFGLNATVVSCETGEARPWLWRHTLITVFGVVSSLLVFTGTAADYKRLKKPAELPVTKATDAPEKRILPSPAPRPSRITEFLLCFSLIKNSRTLFDIRIRDKSLTFLFGMRVLLSLWVVYAHGFLLSKYDNVDPGFSLYEIQTRLSHNLGLGSSYLSVSSFFFITGFLIGYSILRKATRIQKKNLPFYCLRQYVRRYLRLTVPLAVVLMCFLMSDLVTYGAADNKADFYKREFDSCVSHWPSILLHYMNFLPWKNHCLEETWYVATEMQIYVFALPLTLVLLKSRRAFLSITLLVVLSSTAYTMYATWIDDLHPALSFGFPSLNKILRTAEIIYHKPWSHAPTYVMGILCAYCVVHHGKLRLSLVSQAILWWFSIMLTISLILINTVWNGAEDDSSIAHRRALYAFYGSSYRTLWAIAKFWMVYALATGRGGILFRFYSWQGFHVLSKLSYGIFLCHYPILLIRIGRVSTPYQLDLFILIRDGLGRWVLAIAAATILHLFYELPAVNLERFFGRRNSGARPVNGHSHKKMESSSAPEKPLQVMVVKTPDESKL